MPLVNLADESQCVSFYDAVRIGLGRSQGLFFPKVEELPKLPVDELLAMPFAQRSGVILSALAGGDISIEDATEMAQQAFNFAAPVVAVNEAVSCLELFHGPTLAFKDFGARFMALALAKAKEVNGDVRPSTIVTATSGDTGAAVAAAFYRQSSARVVVLYPQNKVSPLQARLFTTLGDNVQSIAVNGDFDQCQALVKQLFNDAKAVNHLNLNSANSINISRLFAQVCYYFEAWAQLSTDKQNRTTIVVPSGNFGNVCAALLAMQLGLPIKRVIAATNSNDTVPRYLKSQQWQPSPTKQTLSNAMDISAPNNWPRVEALLAHHPKLGGRFESVSVSEQDTVKALNALHTQGYLSEPHTAVAFSAFKKQQQQGEHGLIVGTAHPAKFAERVEQILGTSIELPKRLQHVIGKAELNQTMEPNYQQLREFLFDYQ